MEWKTESQSYGSTKYARADKGKLARIKAARGCISHIPGSVEDFLRDKHAELEHDDASNMSEAK